MITQILSLYLTHSSPLSSSPSLSPSSTPSLLSVTACLLPSLIYKITFAIFPYLDVTQFNIYVCPDRYLILDATPEKRQSELTAAKPELSESRPAPQPKFLKSPQIPSPIKADQRSQSISSPSMKSPNVALTSPTSSTRSTPNLKRKGGPDTTPLDLSKKCKSEATSPDIHKSHARGEALT